MLSGLRRKLCRYAAWRPSERRSRRAPARRAGTRPGGASVLQEAPAVPADCATDDGDEVHVLVERRGSALLICAAGSVDASNVAVWRRLVGEAAGAATSPGPLIIDTSGLEFMGVCAFAVLVEESASCRRRGIRLCLVSSQHIASRVVAAAGLNTHFSFAATVEDAFGGAASEDPGPVLGG
ncbi:anti-sigma factor antagonist [Mycobacterium sp. UM_Kg1]|uniref:anti-sigma factor antagonist n=1 Tax=Mycobacterium sp. UM_Kg1 TaxID=1545691 RepID=UPI000698DF6C|nr:anti-sigma factor antagonist [Mycobacterium sp. UM_Kg1]